MRCQPRTSREVYSWAKNNQPCLLCDLPTGHSRPLCNDCEIELPWLGSHCQTCSVPLPTKGLTCGECLRKPPVYQRVEAVWRYDFPVDSLITRFKHQSHWPYGRLLAELLAEYLRHAFAQGLPPPDLLLPVPLARRRLRRRGFNQAEMLANWLGRSLALPVQNNWLQRPQETPAQQQLDAAARKRNLHRAFALNALAEIMGLHLAVIDDVVTTGATAEAIARLLVQAGAARVDIYCLARTPPPGD